MSVSTRTWPAAAFLAIALGVTSAAIAEPVIPIRTNGPQENRLAVAILGDGYTSSELLKFGTDVDLLVQAMFEQPPYSTYANYFNVYRVDVTSNESGADHPERGVTRDTALGAFYNCGAIQRRICVDFVAVNAVISRSLPTNARDIIIVLVNDSEYGGSGGSFSIASTHREVVELVLHEGGHSFGLLADEYDTQPPGCANSFEPAQVNAAREIGRDKIKWARWIEPATPLPTTGFSNGVAGAFEGALYCPTGLFRPTFNSKMRTLFRPFEQINTEQLIRRIYNFVAPIDTVSPPETELSPGPGAVLNFSVETPAPAHGLRVQWFVNDVAMGEGTALLLNTALMVAGFHTVAVEASDRTPDVRNDSTGLLTARRTWTVTVQPQSIEEVMRALNDVIRRWRGPR